MHNINRPILYYHVFLRPGGGFHVTRPALEFGGRYCWSTIWWWMQLSFGSDLGNSGAKIGQLDGQPWRFLDGLSKMIQPRFMCFICGLLDPILVLIWFFWRVPHQKKKQVEDSDGFPAVSWRVSWIFLAKIRRLQEAFLLLLMHGLSCARKLG